LRPAAEVANPLVPVVVVKVAVPPGIIAFDSGVATGGAGKDTVGVMVALASCPVESVTTYFTGEAVPENVGNGLNVTVPFAFTVYAPSFATVNEERLQLALAVDVDAHSFTLVATKVAGAVVESFVSGEIV
jgi:hypothetical protein